MSNPTLLLVAHGTRDGAGTAVIDDLARATRGRVDGEVRVCYVDVVGPTVADALAAIEGTVVAVPAFLASGYHVRVDLPTQISATGRAADVMVTPALGPSAGLTEAVHARLREAGWQRGDPVVLAAAGSSDPAALADVRRAADALGQWCGTRPVTSYVSTAHPRTEHVCTQLDPERTFVASYLLAPGLFHRRLLDLPVRAVTPPIGALPSVTELITTRYRQACRAMPVHG